MIKGRLEREEIQREPQITALYKTMRILILRNMLDAILKFSCKKPAIRYNRLMTTDKELLICCPSKIYEQDIKYMYM